MTLLYTLVPYPYKGSPLESSESILMRLSLEFACANPSYSRYSSSLVTSFSLVEMS